MRSALKVRDRLRLPTPSPRRAARKARTSRAGSAISCFMSGSLFCVRAMKAQRVSAYLHHHGPFGETWGYGNRPSDVPMLALLNNKVIV